MGKEKNLNHGFPGYSFAKASAHELGTDKSVNNEKE
jgi:hypothetical protein